MRKYILVDNEISMQQQNAVRCLMRNLVNSKGIEIEEDFVGALRKRTIYLVDVKNGHTDTLLSYMMDIGMFEYMEEPDTYTKKQICERDKHNEKSDWSIHRFAIVDGKVRWQPDWLRCYPTICWLTGLCFLSDEEVGTVLRGTLYEGRIRFYTGEDFEIPTNFFLAQGCAGEIFKRYAELYNASTATVEFGSIVGEPYEDWKPRLSLGEFTVV